MKNINKLFVCLGVTVACLSGISQPAYAAVAGHVQFVSGNVEVTNPAGQSRQAQKGDAINEGDTLTSAQKSSAQIKMQDGGFVAVRPDTTLKFDRFVFAGKEDGSEKSFFSLFKGGFRAVTGLIGRINKQNYKVTTPAATIGIRGTDHETFLIAPGSPLAQIAPTGAYNKVNVGETTLTTDKGTINVMPNQMGFAAGMNQVPQIQPVNTKVFTVAEAPAPQAKTEKKEEKKEETTEAKQEQTAKSDKEEQKKESGKEGGQDSKQADKGDGDAKGDTQETKQEAAATESKQASTEQAASTSSGQASDTAPTAGGGAAGGTAQETTTTAPAPVPAIITAPQEPAPIRVSAVVDAVPPSAGLIQAPVSPVMAAPAVVTPVIAPPPTTQVVPTTAVATGGTTVNITTGTATTTGGQVIPVTQSLAATQAQTAADAALLAATAAQTAASTVAADNTTLTGIAQVSTAPATTAIGTATTNTGTASTVVTAAMALAPADTATATANATSAQTTATVAIAQADAAQTALAANGTFADSTAGSANTAVQTAAGMVTAQNTAVQTAAGMVAAQNTALATAQSAAATALTGASTNLTTANANLTTANTQNTAITTAQAAIPAQVTAAQTAAANAQIAATAAQTAATLAASLQAAGDLVGAQAQLLIAQQEQVFAEQQLVLAQAAQITAASQLVAAQTAAAAASTAVTAAEQKAIVAATDAATASTQATAAQTAASNAAAALAQTDPTVVSPTPSAANAVQVQASVIAANAPVAAYNNPNILNLPGASHNLMAGHPVTGGLLEVWDTNYGVLNTQYVLDGNKNLVEMRSAGYSTYDQTLLVQGILNANIKFAGGVAQDTYVAPDSSIYMGRWQGGGITVTDMAATAPVAPFTTNLGASSAHWVIGQMVPETLGVSLVQSLAGPTTYTMSAFTKPTDSFGNVGTVTNATLSANFTAQTVASTATFTFSTADSVNISTKNQVFAINQSAMPIINSGFNDSWPVMTTTVGCSGADCGTGTWSAWLYGDFAGTTASSAYVDYALFNRAATGSVHTDMVQSIIAFNTAIPPTVAPPITAQPYVQTDVSLEISLRNNYGSTYYYGGNSITAAANVAPTATTPSFSWDYGCVNCGNHTVQLPGATGAVNGNATSFATTGIQFGRWTNVPAISETFTSTFGPGQINTGTGSSWAYAPEGYLDTPTILSAATGGTVTGVFNYTLSGVAPAPKDQYGTAGTLNSLTLAANFTTQTVSAALSVSLGATNWTANSTTGVINGTGARFNSYLTVTSTNLSVSTYGYLNGAFTGQNYAGAIVDYVIQEWPLAGGATTTSISGVAALTRNSVAGNATVANGTAAPTGKFVVAEGGGYNWNSQTANTATTTGGVLTSYGIDNGAGTTSTTTIVCTICTGQAAQDAATGIQFGTWDTGSRTSNSSQPFGGQFHWIEGPGLDPIYLPEVLLGTMNYTLDGGTAPTNQNGLTGTLSSASLAVNFTSQTVDIALGLTGVNGHSWTASSTGTPLGWTNYSKNGFWVDAGYMQGGSLAVTMDGVATGTGYISGQLTGSGLNGALFQYQLNASLPMPTVPNTFTAADMVTVQAPSVTVTGPVTTGGPASVAFPAGTSGTLVAQPATTLSVALAGGVPITASLSGGVTASVPNLTADPVKTGVYYGTATTGESVSIDTYNWTYGARYSNFGEWRMLPTPAGLAPATATGPFTSGEFAGGMLLTPATSMPVINSAVNGYYSGSMVGGAQDSTTNTPYSLNYGWVDLNANFTTGTLNGSATYIEVMDRNTGSFVGYFNDLSLAAIIATNAFSGSVTANAAPAGFTASPVNLTAGTVGTTNGHFYGPNANELTGIWQLASGTIKASGAFGAGNGTSNNATIETVNGTVALAANAPADTATPYRMVAISAFDFAATASNGGMILDGGFNNTSRVTEVAGNVTAFDSGLGNYNASFNNNSATLAIGTAAASGLGTDPVTGISWGRWGGGSINITDRTTGVVTPSALGTSSLHWIATPSMTAPVALPTTGTYNYVLAGGTAPSDNLGNVGTLNSASLVANFTAQTVDVGVNVSITNAANPTTLVASGTGIPIQQRAMFDAATGNIGAAGMLTATCSGAGCAAAAPTQARISGAFTGTNGVGVGMMYGFNNGGAIISGVAALKQGAQIP